MARRIAGAEPPFRFLQVGARYRATVGRASAITRHLRCKVDLPKPDIQPYAAHVTCQHMDHQGIDAKYAECACAMPIMPDRNARQPSLDREEYHGDKVPRSRSFDSDAH
jgi:hypothetical protein